MSKISITPNASGTGVFTISSPATSTNRTLTLPDEAGTVLINGTTSNVGIGTSSPTFTAAYGGLHIHSTYPELHMTGTDSGSGASDGFKIQKNSANNVYLWNYENAFMAFGTNNTERLRIDSSGNVFVGSDSAGAYPKNGHNIRGGDSAIFSRDSTGETMQVRRNTTNGEFIRFYKGVSTIVGNISLSGSSTAYNTSSDYRLKTDAQPMTGASDRVLALKPVNFAWIVDGTRVDGFLAHEAQAVVPECVTGTKDAMRDEEYEVTAAVYEDIIIAAVLDEEGNELEAERTEQRLVSEAVMGTRSVPDYQGIDQSKLVPLLTAALQEALNKIEAMEIRLAALEAV
jgi:hypothetical protein